MEITEVGSKSDLFNRRQWIFFFFLLCLNVYAIHTEFKLAVYCHWISAIICEPSVFLVIPANHWVLAAPHSTF